VGRLSAKNDKTVIIQEKYTLMGKNYFRYFLNRPCTTACFTQDAVDYLWDTEYFTLKARQCQYYSQRRQLQLLVIPICAIYMNGAWPADQCPHLNHSGENPFHCQTTEQNGSSRNASDLHSGGAQVKSLLSHQPSSVTLCFPHL